MEGRSLIKKEKNTTLANNKVYEAVEFTRKLEMLSLGERIVENDFDNGKVAFDQCVLVNIVRIAISMENKKLFGF